MGPVKNIKAVNDILPRPDRAEAEAAVETLLRYIGEDTSREGLRETPARVIRAYEEFFGGYALDAHDILEKNFSDMAGYEDFVLVKDIDFVSHCEHHMVPIIGKAHIAYWPDQHVVGLSKLARLVDMYARRLISQEIMTTNIRNSLDTILKPRGSAVYIDAVHHCMSARGVRKATARTVTSLFSGVFSDNPQVQSRFIAAVK